MRTLMDPLEPARRDRVPGASALAQAILAPGALRTMFQPIVRLDRAGWTLRAFECLTRGPAGTPFASADALFDAARRLGVVTALDRACVTTALETAARHGITSALFLNVRPETLMWDPTFPEFLGMTAATNGIDWTRVTLEIGAAERHDDATFHSPGARALLALGFHIAVDDVTSAASLDARGDDGYIPSVIKVDGGVFRAAATDLDSLRRVEALARGAGHRGIGVVAQGVDRDEDLLRASSLGIELVQGYHISGPISPARAARAKATFGTFELWTSLRG